MVVSALIVWPLVIAGAILLIRDFPKSMSAGWRLHPAELELGGLYLWPAHPWADNPEDGGGT